MWTDAENRPPGFDPRTVQLVAGRCTDYAVPAHALSCDVKKGGGKFSFLEGLIGILCCDRRP